MSRPPPSDEAAACVARRMSNVGSDRFLPLAESYALGALEAGDRAELEAHLPECAGCRQAVADASYALLGVAASLGGQPPAASAREQLLDLAEAPRWPFDLSALAWEDA